MRLPVNPATIITAVTISRTIVAGDDIATFLTLPFEKPTVIIIEKDFFFLRSRVWCFFPQVSSFCNTNVQNQNIYFHHRKFFV